MDAQENDHELIHKFLDEDDDSALRGLFSRYAGQVHRFLLRFVGSAEAEDLTQETFVKVWRHLHRVDPQRNFRAWLFSIARNTGRDWLRKHQSIPFSDFDDLDGGNTILDHLEDSADLPDAVFATKAAVENIRCALKELPLAARDVVLLHHEAELTFQEIAEIREEPLNTVKSRYRRAVIELKKRLSSI